jgi:hypothetical protein
MSREAVAWAGGVVVEILEGVVVPCLAMANHEDTEVHDRHLSLHLSLCSSILCSVS